MGCYLDLESSPGTENDAMVDRHRTFFKWKQETIFMCTVCYDMENAAPCRPFDFSYQTSRCYLGCYDIKNALLLAVLSFDFNNRPDLYQSSRDALFDQVLAFCGHSSCHKMCTNKLQCLDRFFCRIQ